MSRKRVIYQSEALFAGTTGQATPVQLERVQTANYSFEITRQDVNQYGQLAAIDRIVLEQPTVNLDFSYYLNTGKNEATLGFAINTGSGSASPLAGDKSAIADILSGAALASEGQDEKNYYILTSPEGTDANIDTAQATGEGKVIGIGNGFLSSYSLETSVGDIPTVTVNAEGLNMRFYSGTASLPLPAVNPEDGTNVAGTFTLPAPITGAGFSALRPGDVKLTLAGTNGLNVNDLKIQSATINFDLARDPVQRLGSRFAFARFITFPVTVNMSVDAIIGDIESGNLANVINDDSAKYNLQLKINEPNGTNENMSFVVRGAKLDSQEFSSSIGDNKSVTLNWSTQIGGPTDSGNGLFIYSV